MSYVYMKSSKDDGLWTVGYWQPDGVWDAESDHSTDEAARIRVSWLNGGMDPSYVDMFHDLLASGLK